MAENIPELERARLMLEVASKYILENCPDDTIWYDDASCDGYCVSEDCNAAVEMLSATRTPSKVKPLVWVCEGGWRWKGVPPDGFFKSVAKWVWEKPSGGFKHAGSVEVFDTIEAAKAAAQVDYESRILSALE